jgi:hypothetical protein
VKWRSAWWPGEGEGEGVPADFPGDDPTLVIPEGKGEDEHKDEVPEPARAVEPDEPDEPTVEEQVVPAAPHRRGRPSLPRPKLQRPAAFSVLWPGESPTSVPPDFLSIPADTSELGAIAPRADANPLKPLSPPRTQGQAPFGFRLLSRVVTAVYAALADPLGGDPEARYVRAARVRFACTCAGGLVVAAVLVYAIFPVRTYLDQRAATQRANEQLEVISRENERLAEEAEQLRKPEYVEQLARRDHGMVYPGEESYGVLPPPVTTTTTTTTVPVTVPP